MLFAPGPRPFLVLGALAMLLRLALMRSRRMGALHGNTCLLPVWSVNVRSWARHGAALLEAAPREQADVVLMQ